MKWFGLRQIESDGNGCQSPAERPTGAYFPVALVMLTLVALLLRLYAAADNFGLDEIFNYYLAMYQVHAVSDIFTSINIEHQFLVTLSMYLLGDQLNWVWYRLPSVIAGTGTLALMAMVGYRRMRPVALIVTLAVAVVSYPMVVYSSEARGYAPAAFFSLAMWVLIEAYWHHRNKVWLIGF